MQKTVAAYGEDVMAVNSDSKPLTPSAQLRALMDKLDPKVQKLFRSVRAAIRKRFATANELVYDYGSAVVIGYSPTDHGIDSLVAVRACDTGVSVYFSQGPQLPDPKRLLRGSGKQVRFIPVEAASQLTHPDIDAFFTATTDKAKVPLPCEGKGRLIIMAKGRKKKPSRKKPKRLRAG